MGVVAKYAKREEGGAGAAAIILYVAQNKHVGLPICTQ
jgi:hypothetical protein